MPTQKTRAQENAEKLGRPETPEEETARLARQHAEMDAVMGADNSRDVELGNSKRLFDDAQLATITTFDEAVEALTSATVIDDFDDFGNGFVVLDTKDKRRLEGVPFLIVEWRMNAGENGEFVSAAIVTKHNEKLILNDGSLGIKEQLKSIAEARRANGHQNPQAGLMVKGGLKGKTYQTTANGQEITATTYRLAN